MVRTGDHIEVQPANRADVPFYWGYRVKIEKHPFGQFVRDSGFDLRVATARIGNNFMDVAPKIGEKWAGAEQVLLAFGAPSRGLHEIVADEGLELPALVDFVVNTVPSQGTATVRAEEALLATLAVFNVYFNY